MSIEKVRDYFRPLGREGDILEFPVSSATVELAAQAVGVIPARIAKTLSFLVEEGCVLIVTAGDAKIDNSKYKAMFHTKAKMLTPEQAQEMTGHAVGGVCPFGNPEGVRTYLDIPLQRFDTVFPAAGSGNSAIQLTCDELAEYSRSLGWVDVCKGWQETYGLRASPEMEKPVFYSSTTSVAIFSRNTRSCSTKRRVGRHWRSSSSICIRENRSI